MGETAAEATYVPLPLKWRPRTWNDVVGQEHAVTVLKASLRSNRIFSSYIFAGTAGSGKTSAARIFAMALNCEALVDWSPCLACISCTEALKFRNPDILELDGPSHGGVAHMKELREKVIYEPQNKKRVVIIDEVHSVTRDAFQALLKLLEEPPRHAHFLLATTEPEKIPATIHSRSIKLDFRRHTEQDVVKRLMFIASREDISLMEESALLIARYADGSLRDSVTVLDQLATSYKRKALGVDLVAEVLGIVSGTELHSIMAAVLSHDATALEHAVSRTLERTTEFGAIVRSMTDWYRDVLRVKSGAAAVVRRSQSDNDLLAAYAAALDYSQIASATTTCWELADRVKHNSNNPKTFFLTGLYQLMLIRETPAVTEQGPPEQVTGTIAQTTTTEPPPVTFTQQHSQHPPTGPTPSSDLAELERELEQLSQSR